MKFILKAGNFIRERFLIIALLFILWLTFSGYFQPLMISFGIAGTIVVVYLSVRMRVIGTGEHRPMLYLRLPIYTVWLIWQIIRANVQVAYRIVHPRLPVEPQYLKIKLIGDRPLLHLIHANSITLTPGTISADVKDGYIHVHALSNANARDLLGGKIAEKILWLQGKHNG